MSKYFLARNQQVFGPISESEVLELRGSGQLGSYSWIFKEGDAEWSPIDPAPPLPNLQKALRPNLHLVPEVGETPGTTMHVPRAKTHLIAQERFRIVLFDHHNAISGWLVSASDEGCEIRSDQNTSDPLFVQRAISCLSLHDTKSGETMKLNVRVSLVSRKNGAWSYRLHWGAAPAMIGGSRAERSAVAA